jgi:hypothetical protein
VATTVAYAHSFTYFVDEFSGKSFPGLKFHVSLPEKDRPSADLQAYLDSGAEFSVFDGSLIVSTSKSI